MNYQPRYLAYCRAKGFGPDAMIERDRKSFPGGCMAGFIIWISGLWSAWEKETGNERPHGEADHGAFDLWLESFVHEGE